MPIGESGVGGVGGRPGQPQVERQRLLELGLDQLFVVGEHKSRARDPLAQLRRVGDRARAGLGVVGRLAVGDIQRVGRLPRVEARNRRLGAVGAAERHIDRIVGVQRADLPALWVQQPLAEGVEVGLELRLDAVDQARHGAGLGLGGGTAAAVGLIGRVRRRPLVVIAPVLGEVAVGIHAVADGDLPVAVVVAQILAPQPLDVEGVLVAVGVGRDDEPQLGAS